jgi:hypothetical protein
MFDAALRARFIRYHGEGEAHQADLYRCITCGRLMTWNRIRTRDVCCLGRLTKTNPTWWETVRLLAFPWTL